MTLSQALRERLEALNRQRLADSPRPGDSQTAPSSYTSLVGNFARACAGALAVNAADSHGDSLPSPSEVTNFAGSHLLYEQPLAAFWRGSSGVWQPAESPAEDPPPRTDQLTRTLLRLRAIWPHGLLLFDLETCGLAGSPIFLAGLVREGGQGPVLEQLLARDYSEEPAILASLWQRVAECQMLVSFNGKSFDWPLVQDRSNLHGLGRDMRGRRSAAGPVQPAIAPPRGPRDPRPQPQHCDLLHHARRRWRQQLPDCKLQTLEGYLCRRLRRADVPGREIPQRYHQYVRERQAHLLAGILSHNALDLVTLAQLTWILVNEPIPPPATKARRAGNRRASTDDQQAA